MQEYVTECVAFFIVKKQWIFCYWDVRMCLLNQQQVSYKKKGNTKDGKKLL